MNAFFQVGELKEQLSLFWEASRQTLCVLLNKISCLLIINHGGKKIAPPPKKKDANIGKRLEKKEKKKENEDKGREKRGNKPKESPSLFFSPKMGGGEVISPY